MATQYGCRKRGARVRTENIYQHQLHDKHSQHLLVSKRQYLHIVSPEANEFLKTNAQICALKALNIVCVRKMYPKPLSWSCETDARKLLCNEIYQTEQAQNDSMQQSYSELTKSMWSVCAAIQRLVEVFCGFRESQCSREFEPGHPS